MARTSDKIKHLMYERLRKEGFTDVAARGIIANFAYETGNFKWMEELAPNKFNTKGKGIAQWTNTPNNNRRDQFENYMREHNLDINDPIDQLEYFIYEITHKPENMPWGRRMSKDTLNKAKTIEEATDIFMKGYEAPKDQSPEHRDKRVAYLEGFNPNQPLEELEDPRYKLDTDLMTKRKDNIQLNPDLVRMKVPTKESIKANLDDSLSTVGPDTKAKLDAALERVINKAVNFESNYTKVASEMLNNANERGNLEYRDVEEIAGPVEGESNIQKKGIGFAEGGYLQPNGRVTSFTRPEDIIAQNNTTENERSN